MLNWQGWEKKVLDDRLWCNHLIACQSEKFGFQKRQRFRKKEKELVLQIKKLWKYKANQSPAPIELAWIIYSQLGWKGTNLEEEELWEDIPEIDPIEIMAQCQEIEEKESQGDFSEPLTLIPEDILFSLREVLRELAYLGADIRGECYSLNWTRGNKRHGGGRIQEIASRNKDRLIKLKEELQKSGRLMRYTKDGKKRNAKKKTRYKKGPSKSKILASFFGLG